MKGNDRRVPLCCPRCGSHEFSEFESEVFCKNCDWDSIENSVSCGRYDELFDQACEEIANQEAEMVLGTDDEDGEGSAA